MDIIYDLKLLIEGDCSKKAWAGEWIGLPNPNCLYDIMIYKNKFSVREW